MSIHVENWTEGVAKLIAVTKNRKGEPLNTTFEYDCPDNLDEIRDLFGEKAVMECFIAGALADLDREHARIASGGRGGKNAMSAEQRATYMQAYPLCRDWREVLRAEREAAAAERARKAAERALAKLTPEDRAKLLS